MAPGGAGEPSRGHAELFLKRSKEESKNDDQREPFEGPLVAHLGYILVFIRKSPKSAKIGQGSASVGGPLESIKRCRK